jgi:hypothetical protein
MNTNGKLPQLISEISTKNWRNLCKVLFSARNFQNRVFAMCCVDSCQKEYQLFLSASILFIHIAFTVQILIGRTTTINKMLIADKSVDHSAQRRCIIQISALHRIVFSFRHLFNDNIYKQQCVDSFN